jgi:hypothetical protein
MADGTWAKDGAVHIRLQDHEAPAKARAFWQVHCDTAAVRTHALSCCAVLNIGVLSCNGAVPGMHALCCCAQVYCGVLCCCVVFCAVCAVLCSWYTLER